MKLKTHHQFDFLKMENMDKGRLQLEEKKAISIYKPDI